MGDKKQTNITASMKLKLDAVRPKVEALEKQYMQLALDGQTRGVRLDMSMDVAGEFALQFEALMELLAVTMPHLDQSERVTMLLHRAVETEYETLMKLLEATKGPRVLVVQSNAPHNIN